MKNDQKIEKIPILFYLKVLPLYPEMKRDMQGF